jgi:hypothetical protein
MSRVQSVKTEDRNLHRKSGIGDADLHQKSGLSKMSSSSISIKKVRDQPDQPARAQEGADDIFLQLSSAMRRTGKMTPLHSASRAPKFQQAEAWQFREKDVSILRKASSEANKSSKVHGRLLADIDAGKAINRLIGFEASFEDFSRCPREPRKVKAAIQHMIHQLRVGLSADAIAQGDVACADKGPHDETNAPGLPSNMRSSKGKSALYQNL